MRVWRCIMITCYHHKTNNFCGLPGGIFPTVITVHLKQLGLAFYDSVQPQGTGADRRFVRI